MKRLKSVPPPRYLAAVLPFDTADGARPPGPSAPMPPGYDDVQHLMSVTPGTLYEYMDETEGARRYLFVGSGHDRVVEWNARDFETDASLPWSSIDPEYAILALLEREQDLARLNRKLQAEADALAQANETIRRIAATDPLTNLANRRHFRESLEKACAYARRHGSAVTIVSFDLDGLKLVNDTKGHAAGDGVLTSFAAILTEQARTEDVLGRLGGDEFTVLLVGADEQGGWRFAKRVQQAVRACRKLSAAGITVSSGVAGWKAGHDGEELLRRADEALYHAKHRGGDAVEVHGAA